MLLLDSLAIVKICESHLQLSGQAISITATLLTLIGPTSEPALLCPALNSRHLTQSFEDHLCHNISGTIIQFGFWLPITGHLFCSKTSLKLQDKVIMGG